MKPLLTLLLAVAACRSGRPEESASIPPPPVDPTVVTNDPVWIGLYYCTEGVVLGSTSPAPPLVAGSHETSITVSDADIFAIYAGLVREGIREERDRGAEIIFSIPPATYTIVISTGPSRTEARFYHVPGYELPGKYLAEFERYKAVASTDVFRTIRENNAALSERR